jgi:hypothetical protein
MDMIITDGIAVKIGSIVNGSSIPTVATWISAGGVPATSTRTGVGVTDN